MSWSRTTAVGGLAAALAVTAGETCTVYSRPPQTLNAPALVVGWPSDVQYATAGLGVDQATLPVYAVGPPGGEETVDTLIGVIRAAVAADRTLGGAVQIVVGLAERGWRMANVAGVEVLQAEVALTIEM